MTRSLFCLLFAIGIYPCLGQKRFTGIIVDSASYAPLANVNVQIRSKYQGVTTDERGNFSISASPDDTLFISLLGYRSLELPLYDYETGMILMSQQETMLAPIIIHDSRISANPYDGMFDEQNELLKKKIPFYFTKAKKDRLKAANWRLETLRVQTYIDLVVHNPETKRNLMQKFSLSEKEYYEILTRFNEKHYTVMYHLSSGELLSLINRFFEMEARQ